MKTLVTGNLGYIGSVLTETLIMAGHEVTGLDAGYFADCLLSPIQNQIETKLVDVRNVQDVELSNLDAVIHLAGLSNDPVGDLNKILTFDIKFGFFNFKL